MRMSVVDTFFTVKNLLNAQLIGVNISNDIKLSITTFLRMSVNCVVNASNIDNLKMLFSNIPNNLT